MHLHKYFNDALIYLLLWVLLAGCTRYTVYVIKPTIAEAEQWKKDHPGIKIISQSGSVIEINEKDEERAK
jgi:hypothetical protein